MFQLLLFVFNCTSGRFLADCYEALEDAGCSITLRINHRSESQIIVDNAELIRQQTDPVFYELNDELRHFRQIPLDDSGDNGKNTPSFIGYSLRM